MRRKNEKKGRMEIDGRKEKKEDSKRRKRNENEEKKKEQDGDIRKLK